MSQVFARRASGLVREANLLDTVLFGIMNNGAAVSVWYYITGAPYLFPGVNQIVTFLVGGFLGILGFGMIWGILGAAMPRSGGSYVYNSRIIHPAIGTAVSFANAGFVMTAWIWVLAPWIADPGLPILAGAIGLSPDVVAWWTQPVGMYIVATVTNFFGLLVVIGGLKKFFYIQRVFIGLSLLGVAVAAILFTVTSHSTFVDIWNSLAGQHGSPTWSETLALVDQEIGLPTDWNILSSLGAILPLSWGIIYGYVISFIGGEVKSPRRNIFIGQILNIIVMITLTAWTALSLEKMVGWDGLHVLAYIDNELPAWYTLPFPPTFLNLASMLVGFNMILGLLFGLSFIFADFLWIPFSYIAFSRGLFAWGMDRIGPMWFTDINPKVHQPIKLLITEFILGQIGITWYVTYPTILAGFSVEVMQLFSVFGFTALSCLIFPFIARVRHIWEASPHKEWKIIGIPYAAIAGFLTMILVGILVWANFYTEGMALLNNIWVPIYITVWVSGLLWYFGWKTFRAKEGIDVTLAFKELAPE
jgi:amino acid transporter